jgi:transmembrane sensor
VGTVFNIESRDGKVSVSVLEGEVEVTAGGAHDAVSDIGSGQGISFDSTGLLSPVAKVDADEVVAWRELKLFFHDQPLSEALARLAPYHDVAFEFSDRELSRMRISGSFHIGDLNLFLKTLETAFPVRAKVLDSHHVRLQRRT